MNGSVEEAALAASPSQDERSGRRRGASVAGEGPTFLVIAPPKTGTTWLCANLERHPDVFVAASKEVRYFSRYWRNFDLQWYVAHFAGAAEPARGEATPLYSILPRAYVREVGRLLPELKLVLLMRDPVDRAWSQARYEFGLRRGELGTRLRDFRGAFDDVPLDALVEFLSADVVSMTSDYETILRNWTSVFPGDRLFIGAYDDIRERPKTLLSRIFRFLGVGDPPDWEGFRLTERINQSQEAAMPPAIRSTLDAQWHDRLGSLAELLETELHARALPRWLGAARVSAPRRKESGELEQSPPVAGPTADGEVETREFRPVLALDSPAPCLSELEWEARALAVMSRASAVEIPQMVEAGYRGFNIVAWNGRLFALAERLGPVDVTALGPRALEDLRDRGLCWAQERESRLKAWIDAVVQA